MSMTIREAAKWLGHRENPPHPAVQRTYTEEEMQQARKEVAERCAEIAFDPDGVLYATEVAELIRKEFGIE
jgi:nitrogenase molybdenum-iron protein alpha/beta subunit